jgi:soluble lytic murein transglycosylase
MGIEAVRDGRLPEEVTHRRESFRSCDAGSGLFCALIILALVSFCFLPAAASAGDGKGYFKEGKKDLDAGRYKEAVEKLSHAAEEFPLLGDYAVLYLADAYHNLGDHSKALDTVRVFLKKFPQSPLIGKARAAELAEAGDSADEDLSRVFDAYVKDYPDDEERYFLYGLFLKRSGNSKRAAEVFERIYVQAGSFAGQAYAELDPGCLNAADRFARVSNLMKQFRFREAERELRRMLAKGGDVDRDEAMRDLGLAVFRQKEYREAAAIYEKMDDTYSVARSLYRAGDKEGFEAAVKALIGKHDQRTGYLLLALASDKRREGDTKGARKIYEDIIRQYPQEKEDAMWGIGWTRYVSGEYKEASEVFSDLYSCYEEPKYLYWHARSKEALGEDAKGFYQALLPYENSFYVALSAALGKVQPSRGASPELPEAPSVPQKGFERVDALLSLDMQKEAGDELQWMAKQIDSPQVLIAVAARLQKIGDFRHAVGLAARMPYSEKMHRFWYPLAFREEVEIASKENGIDPMIALSVMREESRFDPDAKSVAGARGLMQLMPRTAFRLDRNVNLGISKASEINDVGNNIRLGVYYLKSLFKEFGSLPHVLAAYNAGEAAVRKWEEKGDYKSVDEFIEDIPYPETRDYVKKVITSYYQYKRFSPSESKASASIFGSL